MNLKRAEKQLAIVFLAIMLLLTACHSMHKNASGPVAPAATTAGSVANKTPVPMTDITQQFRLSGVASIHMINQDTGWIWGGTGSSIKLFRTNDGGRHWQPDLANGDLPTSLGLDYLSTAKLFPQNQKNLTIVWTDEKGLHVFHSTNEGAKWQEAVIPNQDIAQDIAFVDENHGWILTTGMDAAMGHTQKKVYRTTDGGKMWTIVSSDSGYIPDKNATKEALPQYGSATGITFSDADRGWATLENWMDASVRLFRTADSGRTWKQVNLQIPTGIDPKKSYSIPQKPQFFSRDNRMGMMIVAFRNDTQVRFAKYETQDGAVTWSSFVIPEAADAEINRQGMTFMNMMKGWALLNNKLWATQDGGHHWTKLEMAYTLQQTLKDYPIILQFQFTNPKSGWLLCKSGHSEQWAFLTTADGGMHWAQIQSG